jgi:hypothetical protein
MSMVAFLPWCKIKKAYDVGEVQLLPFERHKPIDGLDEAAQGRVNTILATYKTIEGNPVDSAAIVRYGEKLPVDDLSEEERKTIRELMVLACFCALARREYFNSLGPYCNSDSFALYVQKFDKADFTALATRRREGQTLSGWPIDEIMIAVPTHCDAIREVSLDEAFLKALTVYRAQSQDDEWARWQNAISCFNQANTDSENVRYQVEWVLLGSAFEHLVGATSDAKDVADKLSKILTPKQSLLAYQTNRRSDRRTDHTKPLRYEWMREFYRVRGDFAHGKLTSRQPTVWNPLEHLVLGTIAFPLVAKCLLQKAGKYTLTTDDQVQIDVFEALADTKDFLRPPSDQKNSLDSHWKRLRDAWALRLTVEKALEKCAAEGLIPEELAGDTSLSGDSTGKGA